MEALGFLALYLLPTIIVCTNGHTDKMGVFLVNLLLGWTILGWIGALIWAVCHKKEVK